MRRRLTRYLPFMALALLVQLMAPLGALRAVASIAADPLAMATICTGIHESRPQDLPSDAGAACCAFCAAAAIHVPNVGPNGQDFVLLERPFALTFWMARVAAPSPRPDNSQAQARAPPPAVV